MSRPKIADILAYTVVTVTLGLGLVIFVGLLFPSWAIVPDYVPLQMRVMFGIVAVLMGVYRLVMMRFQAARSNESDEEDLSMRRPARRDRRMFG